MVSVTRRVVRVLFTGAIAVTVLALVIKEALSAPALATGDVRHLCGSVTSIGGGKGRRW